MPMNYTRTALLLAVLTAIFLLVGAAVGGKTGMIIAFVIALAMNIFSLWKSDTLVLKLFKAKPVTEHDAPQLYDITRKLAERADLPMPKLFVIESHQPNAFATGRSPAHASVAVSTGLIKILNAEETAGVIAHELAHIKNRDTLTMAVAATIGGATSMLAQYLQFGLLFGRRGNDSSPLGWIGALATIILAPFAAMLVQMAISRSREYQADRMGGLLVGNPKWLASALVKIHNAAKRTPNPTAERVPATAHMFIVNPLTGQGFDNFFSTHPNVENRLRELDALSREMAAGQSNAKAPLATGQVVQDKHRGPWAGRRRRPGGRRGPWG